jgi:hypothetical protein
MEMVWERGGDCVVGGGGACGGGGRAVIAVLVVLGCVKVLASREIPGDECVYRMI